MGQLRSIGNLNSSRAFMDALHCDMAQQRPDLLLKKSKKYIVKISMAAVGTKPSHYLSLSSSSFLGSKFSYESLAAV